jgi:hypothetical protein
MQRLSCRDRRIGDHIRKRKLRLHTVKTIVFSRSSKQTLFAACVAPFARGLGYESKFLREGLPHQHHRIERDEVLEQRQLGATRLLPVLIGSGGTLSPPWSEQPKI